MRITTSQLFIFDFIKLYIVLLDDLPFLPIFAQQ